MLWTCTHCDYNRVSWRPRSLSERQVGAVARAHCMGQPHQALRKARGFLFIGNRYVLDAPIRCPRCRQTFFPGDALERTAEALSSEPVPAGPASRLAS